jgi:hypothetical protein
MTVAESEGNFATAASWIVALDEAAMPEELVLRVITGCRAQPCPKLASYLSFYTQPIMRALARVKANTAPVAGPATVAAPVPAAVAIAAAVPPAPPSVRPGPSQPAAAEMSIKVIACKAIAWAKLDRQPRPTELGEIQGWRNRAAALGLTDAATLDLMQGVIELTVDRDLDPGTIPPTSLQYFGRPMCDALKAISRHRVGILLRAGASAKAGVAAPPPPAAATASPVKEGMVPPVKEDTVSSNPSESLNLRESNGSRSSSNGSLVPARANAHDLSARPLARLAAIEERLLRNGSCGAVPSPVVQTALAPVAPSPSDRPIGARHMEVQAIVAEVGKALRPEQALVTPPVEMQRAVLEDQSHRGTPARGTVSTPAARLASAPTGVAAASPPPARLPCADQMAAAAALAQRRAVFEERQRRELAARLPRTDPAAHAARTQRPAAFAESQRQAARLSPGSG